MHSVGFLDNEKQMSPYFRCHFGTLKRKFNNYICTIQRVPTTRGHTLQLKTSYFEQNVPLYS